MNDEQFQIILQMLQVLNTGVNQLIDINMQLLGHFDPNERDLINRVHNVYGKFLSDDSWLEQEREAGLID